MPHTPLSAATAAKIKLASDWHAKQASDARENLKHAATDQERSTLLALAEWHEDMSGFLAVHVWDLRIMAVNNPAVSANRETSPEVRMNRLNS